MNRSLPRFAALLLIGVSAAACSSFDSSTSSKPAPSSSSNAAPAKPGKTLASDIDAQVRNAQALRAQGDYAGATRILAQLTLVAPDNPNVVGEYGKALVQQGRPHDALDFLNRAAQLQPSDWTLYSAMGVAYDQDGDYSKARGAYQQALALRPGTPSVLNNYALSRMQAGDLVTAHQLSDAGLGQRRGSENRAQRGPACQSDPGAASCSAGQGRSRLVGCEKHLAARQ